MVVTFFDLDAEDLGNSGLDLGLVGVLGDHKDVLLQLGCFHGLFGDDRTDDDIDMQSSCEHLLNLRKRSLLDDDLLRIEEVVNVDEVGKGGLTPGRLRAERTTFSLTSAVTTRALQSALTALRKPANFLVLISSILISSMTTMSSA